MSQKTISRVISISYFFVIGIILLFVIAVFVLDAKILGELSEAGYNWLLRVIVVISAIIIGVAIAIWREKWWGYLAGLIVNVFIFVFYFENFTFSSLTIFDFPIFLSAITTPFLIFFLIKSKIGTKYSK